jgi:glycosyltransferase involved in cell wall biosynthesis
MRVSIIIPTYNSEKTVEKCLLSLNEQTTRLFEIIVVDGGSKDATIEIMRKFDNIKLVINEKSHRPGSSRNLASKIAEGDIFLFIDSDCIADRRVVEYHLKSYEKRDDIIGVKGAVRSLEKCQISDFVQKQLMASQWLNLNPDGIMRLFHAGTNFSILKSVFLNNKFKETLVSCEDTELFIRLKKNGLKVLYEPRAFVYHRHPTTLEELFKQRKWHGEGISQLVNIWGKDFTDLYPLFTPEKYVNEPKENLVKAIFSDNRLLCEDCKLEQYLECKIDSQRILNKHDLDEEIPEKEIRRVICLAVAAGILKQRENIDYRWCNY